METTSFISKVSFEYETTAPRVLIETTEETYSVDDGQIKIHNRNTTKVRYKRDDDISSLPENIKQLITTYWQTL